MAVTRIEWTEGSAPIEGETTRIVVEDRVLSQAAALDAGVAATAAQSYANQAQVAEQGARDALGVFTAPAADVITDILNDPTSAPNARLTATFGRGKGVFNANAAPYFCKPNDAAYDNSAGMEAAITAAINYAIANGGGSVVVELDDGEYFLNRAPQATEGCYAQVPILPRVTRYDKMVSLLIRGKQGSRALPYPYFGKTNSGVVFRTTATNQNYSSVNGWPSMFGFRDAIHNSGDFHDYTSWMHLHFQGVGFRQPENPWMCAVNAGNIDQRTFEDCRWDTLGFDQTGSTPWVTNAPTHPTGIADIPPANNLDGNFWKGVNFCAGYYAGPSIAELMNNQGMIFSYENYIALNMFAPYYHLADLGNVIDCRCPYGIAAVDPVNGIIAIPAGLASTKRTHLKGTIDYEDGNARWTQRVKHIYDPGNALGGHIDYMRVVAGGVGSVSGRLNITGASGITYKDLTRNEKTTHLYHTFTSANSTASAGPADTGQIEKQALGVWGVSSGQAYLVSGTGFVANLWEAGISEGEFQIDVTFPTASGIREAMLVFRANDANNLMVASLYRALDGTARVSLFARNAGAFNQIGPAVSVDITPGIQHNLKALCFGSNMEIVYDDRSIISQSILTGQESATRIGIGGINSLAGVQFDYLAARTA